MVVLEPGSDSTIGVGHSQTDTIHGEPLMIGSGLNVGPRDYYPSPPSTETESSGSVIQPQPPRRIMQQPHHIDQGQGDGPSTETSGRYPEYKH